MGDSKFYVYLLRRMDNNRVFYVGETSRPEQRFRQHMGGETVRTYYVIKPLQKSGVKVEMQIVGEFDTREKARKYEAELIERAWRKNYWLVNDAIIPDPPELKRNGRYWTDKERQQARHLYETEQRPLLEVAQSLQRSVGAVAYQLKQQGVVIQW